jgi:hypothetical protein
MADVQHAAQTGADLHESKGVDSAAADLVAVTNGSGSTTFQDIKNIGSNAVHSEVFMNGNATVTVINTTNVYENVAGTFTAGNVQGITIANGIATAITAGVYKVDASLSLLAAANNQVIQFDVGVDVGAGFVAHNQGATRRLIATGSDVGALSIQATLTLAAGDDVRLQVRNTTSTANVTVTEINCVSFLLQAV